MDFSFVILACLLLMQMIIILIMLNPIYDVRKLTDGINFTVKSYKRSFFFSVLSYFTAVVYLGMFVPLQNIHKLVITTDLTDLEKITLLHRVERNYVIAGFSLFLVVVIYGVRSLLSYTASITELAEKHSGSVNFASEAKGKDCVSPMNILPNLLRVKRSISYETILFTKELQEKLKVIIKRLPSEISTLSNMLDTTTA